MNSFTAQKTVAEIAFVTEPFCAGELPMLRCVPPGPQSRAAAARLQDVDCPAFAVRRELRAGISQSDMAPIVLASGRGANLFDVDGNRYVDLVAGFGSVLLGHGAPAVVKAVASQSERLIQGLGDVYVADVKIEVQERLAALHPGENPRVLMTQSGADALTAAIKTAALATGRPGLVAMEGSYHGLSYAPLAACGFRESFRLPFQEQLNRHVRFVPFAASDDGVQEALSRLDDALSRDRPGAVLIEPILGRGGCAVPSDDFLRRVCALSKQHGALVIADEVWTGLGRSGSMVRMLDAGAEPDILCFGKGLGGGLPISACVAPARVMDAWARGGEVVHTSTHAGLPLACAAALATLNALRDERLVERSASLGGYFCEALRGALRGLPGVRDVRGKGLMIGIELESAAQALRVFRAMLERGFIVLTGGSRGEVLTLTPPLTIPKELLDGSVMAFVEAIKLSAS